PSRIHDRLRAGGLRVAHASPRAFRAAATALRLQQGPRGLPPGHAPARWGSARPRRAARRAAALSGATARGHAAGPPRLSALARADRARRTPRRAARSLAVATARASRGPQRNGDGMRIANDAATAVVHGEVPQPAAPPTVIAPGRGLFDLDLAAVWRHR